MKKPAYKTARCVLRYEDRYLLVMHGGRFRSSKKWGLPGGHVERNEEGLDAVRRELKEELYLQPEDVGHHDYVMLGDFYYRQHHHRVYGADIAQPISRFDRRELVKIAWFPVKSVLQLAREDQLHAGYEVDAVLQYHKLTADDST